MEKPIFSLDLAEHADVAMSYHGGMGSMLYAVASTGALKCGTSRPRERCECDDGCKLCQGKRYRDLTDREWFRDLCERLETEASESADLADADTEDEDAPSHAESLREIERAARRWLDEDTMRTEVIAYLAHLDRTPPFWIEIPCGPCERERPDSPGCEHCTEGKVRNPDMLGEDGSLSRLELRLRVHDGRWAILTGDSQYDQDHRGACGATSVPWIGDTEAEEFDPEDVADELIDDLDGGEDTED